MRLPTSALAAAIFGALALGPAAAAEAWPNYGEGDFGLRRTFGETLR